MEKIIGIYCIENKLDHKKYIGQSIDVADRWQRHIRHLNNHCHHNELLQQAWNEYGFENFDFYVLQVCTDSELDSLEKRYICMYDSMNHDKGYNLASGGKRNFSVSDSTKQKIGKTSRGRKFSDEVKKRMSETRKGSNNGFYGKHHTEETKEKMRNNQTDKSGENNPRFNPEPVICIETGEIYSSAYVASKKLGLYSSGIRKCCEGKLKTTGGLRFQFYIQPISENN